MNDKRKNPEWCAAYVAGIGYVSELGKALKKASKVEMARFINSLQYDPDEKEFMIDYISGELVPFYEELKRIPKNDNTNDFKDMESGVSFMRKKAIASFIDNGTSCCGCPRAHSECCADCSTIREFIKGLD